VCFKITTDHAVGHWVAARIEGGYHEERSRAIGLMKNGEYVAGVIYENWNKRSIFCHIAIDGQITPSYLAAIFDYPFNVCGVEKIIVSVFDTNAKSLTLVKKMGFKEEAKLQDAQPNGDIVLLVLNKSNCRFLGEKYGKKYTSTTASA